MRNIISLIQSNKDVERINRLFSENKDIYINNTNEDNALLVLLALYYKNQESIFVVTPNLYKAQLLYDKLSRVLDKNEISFYPQDEFLTNELLVSSIEFRLERINTIVKSLEKTKRIIITNLYGLLKPQLPYEKWKNSEIKIETNSIYDIDELKNVLIEYGYKKEYTVEKMGDFSIRGGIIDIFPVNSKQPYRLDFFGDEVEIIKSFDIDTQRSIDVVERFSIYPIIEFFYNESELTKLKLIIDEKRKSINFSKDAIDAIKDDIEKLDSREELDR
ncbi:MAG: hypothetical protein CVV62_02560, partial [Tenericutes bacterium HGW-Tenericutes-7]